jgi:hypothetical protein
MSDADSSCIGSFGTPVEAASLPRCAMSDTNASFHNTIVTSLMSASLDFPLSAMCDTNASPNDSVATPVVAASFLY